MLLLRESLLLQFLLGGVLVGAVWVGTRGVEMTAIRRLWNRIRFRESRPVRQHTESNRISRSNRGESLIQTGTTSHSETESHLTHDERVDALLEYNPHWERDRVDRLIRGLNTDYSQDEDE